MEAAERPTTLFSAWTPQQNRNTHDLLKGVANHISNGDEAAPISVFQEINGLSSHETEKLRAAEAEEASAKYHDGIAGRIARSKRFEATTITFIMLNAVEIGAESDYAARHGPFSIWAADAPAFFLIAENLFCFYFSVEILVRLFAYKTMRKCIEDAWFVFDCILVTFMVFETWILPMVSGASSPLGELSILRLLRLLRVTRMAKLMRMFPELMMIVKSIVAAAKAVVWTVILLIIVTYSWALLFTHEYHQGKMGDLEVEDGDAAVMFGSMGKSLLSLLVMGTILDDVTAAADTIRSTNNNLMLGFFLMDILINSFTMMNMLVGILVEVVGDTAQAEKTRLLEEHAGASIRAIFDSMDQDGNGLIGRDEFFRMRESATVMKALRELDIEEKQFNMYTEIIFETDSSGEDAYISSDQLLTIILRLRPGTHVSALDFAAFKNIVDCQQQTVRERLTRVDRMLSVVGDAFGIQGPPSRNHHRVRTTGGYHGGLSAPVDEDGDRSSTPEQMKSKGHKRINVEMLDLMDTTASADILHELQRRLGLENIDETGVPLDMVDDDLRERLRAAQAFPTLNRPGAVHCEPAWKVETISC
eukprot:TRINITY_DN70128_c0_g1_i1.p1 TRINITY_DN70128_c0_g1~~TRINITY_DN70128_c0_g1_i1.p1  ORF type:complete len:590 (+),score=116.87 TRINITY_DN70128_c0_g1_i1:149-1918(+)